MSDLIERLRKRAAEERAIAMNNKAVADILWPEVERFKAHDGPFNLYAARVGIDHQNNYGRDLAFANDLDEAIRLIEGAHSVPTRGTNEEAPEEGDGPITPEGMAMVRERAAAQLAGRTFRRLADLPAGSSPGPGNQSTEGGNHD